MRDEAEPTDLAASDRRGAANALWSWSTGLVPLSLVVVALLASVIIPARQTWVITTLLRETTDVLAPARLMSAQLQSGLADEMGALQSYALSGDSASLRLHAAIVAENDQRLANLAVLGAQLDGSFGSHVVSVRERVTAWRRLAPAATNLQRDRGAVARSLAAARSQLDASRAAVADLSADLSKEARARDDRVEELERYSLAANAAMVFAAFAALYAVLVLTLRERRLAGSLRRRVAEESARARAEKALRQAAEELAGAFAIDEVTQGIAHAALEALGGRGAFVERIANRTAESSVIVTAVAGNDGPPVGTTCGLHGSYAEQVLAAGEPILIPALEEGRHPGVLGTLDDPRAPAIVIPLGSPASPVGALFVLSATGPFRAEDAERAAIFGHLAVLAYSKVQLLEEALEGRKRLQQVITSRSRLMRGFSHDVKNPIGAADGYAELLTEGVYGELTPGQRESVVRMRRCMRGALALIDDLHELARAETGHLDISAEPVDLADLVRHLGEEYQATADAGGLQLTVNAAAEVPLIRTSRTRVRQIASNLLSNAIKYTDGGSVAVTVMRQTSADSTDAVGWVLIEVSDTGRGIPADKLDYIFQEFGRVAGNERPGAGLGLAISRLLAQALGGRITVSSEVGRGSTFTLWLPLARDTGAEMPAVRVPPGDAIPHGDERAAPSPEHAVKSTL
ncbi:MAG TPA: HAMP domain-containing sensor histidine kinase [Gemmatimonadaceae bacterium]